MKNEIVQGVVLLSGMPGAGKTTAAMTIAPPSDLVLLDFDLKDEQRCRSLSIPYFKPEMDITADPTGNDLQELLTWTRQAFMSIAEEGKNGRDTLVIDNGSPLEEAFAYAVAMNPARYGVNPRNAQTGAYGGVNPGVAVIWQNTIRYFLSNGYKRIVICMHMSQSWANGVPIDKMKVKGNRVLSQLSNLSVVLIRASLPNQPPVGLVGKEALGLLRWNEVEHKYHVSMALPPRVEKFEWSTVARYIKEFDEGTHKTFRKDEVWTEKELEQYSPWLSDAQRDFILTIAKNPNFRLDEGDESAVMRETLITPGSPSSIKKPVDWNGLVEFARISCGMEVENLKKFITEEFGGFDIAEIEKYFQALLRNQSSLDLVQSGGNPTRN